MEDAKNTYGKWVASGLAEKDPEKKVVYYSKALELNPNHAPAWGLRGAALMDLGKYEEAARCFDKVLEIRSDAEAWYNKGLCFYYLETYKEAIECFNKTLETCQDEDRQLLEDALYNKKLAEEKLRGKRAMEAPENRSDNYKVDKQESKSWWRFSFRRKKEDRIAKKCNSDVKAREQQLLGELAVEKTVQELTRVVDIPGMAEGAFGDRAVISGFAKYKGLDYWMAITDYRPEVQDNVKNKLSQLYNELLEHEADEETAQKRFKEIYKGFSNALDHAGTEMRANGWNYPWE